MEPNNITVGLELEKFYSAKSEEAITKAIVCGLEVIYRGPGELLVDLDDVNTALMFMHRLVLLEKFLHVLEVAVWASRTPGHLHARVSCAPYQNDHNDQSVSYRYLKQNKYWKWDFTPQDVVFLQGLLGSDPIRELVAMKTFEQDQNYSILFRPQNTPEAWFVAPGRYVRKKNDPPNDWGDVQVWICGLLKARIDT